MVIVGWKLPNGRGSTIDLCIKIGRTDGQFQLFSVFAPSFPAQGGRARSRWLPDGLFSLPSRRFLTGCADRSSEAASTDSPDALRPRLATSARRHTGKIEGAFPSATTSLRFLVNGGLRTSYTVGAADPLETPHRSAAFARLARHSALTDPIPPAHARDPRLAGPEHPRH